MKKKRVLRIIRRYYKRLQKKCKLMPPAYDVEVIHSFRTNYKKLKAFLKMLPPKHGVPDQLKDLYHHLGALRDLQLQEREVKVQGYKKSIRLQIHTAQKRLNKLLAKKPVKKSRRQTIHAVSCGVSHNDYRKLLKKNTLFIRKMLLAGTLSDTSLHAIRKKLKEISNAGKIFHDDSITATIPGLIYILDPAADLQDKLGSFQDKRNAVQLLHKNWPEQMDAGEENSLRKKEAALQSEKEQLKAQVLRELKAMLEQSQHTLIPVTHLR